MNCLINRLHFLTVSTFQAIYDTLARRLSKNVFIRLTPQPRVGGATATCFQPDGYMCLCTCH